MKRIHFIFTILGFFWLCGFPPLGAQPAQQENPHGTTFFYALNDVPLMPGLRELSDEALHFDKPEGRIVAATALGETLAPEAIQRFYGAVLPQLGWIPAGEGSFLRGEERLRLNIQSAEGVSIVRLQVAPR
ncbi:MAG: hypothetical protein HYS17_02635 [Micavibrio aeruginosavorus]|uniref:Uncharacterized protein n=1 Tax=Micavibrio aeruginosavorus TaxID=349221 RepID=A0A7T5R386_9BACT|nr:MAG: hypothetical protein HYS17_02635 [Micavibrio aeruginosavorus]